MVQKIYGKTCNQLSRPTFLCPPKSSMFKFARRFLQRKIYFYSERDIQLSFFIAKFDLFFTFGFCLQINSVHLKKKPPSSLLLIHSTNSISYQNIFPYNHSDQEFTCYYFEKHKTNIARKHFLKSTPTFCII